MKKLITLMLLLVIVFNQCSELRKPDNKKITIAGKIIGAEGEFITLNSFEELKKLKLKRMVHFPLVLTMIMNGFSH